MFIIWFGLFVENSNCGIRRKDHQTTNCELVCVVISVISRNPPIYSGTRQVKRDSERSRPVITEGPTGSSLYMMSQIRWALIRDKCNVALITDMNSVV